MRHAPLLAALPLLLSAPAFAQAEPDEFSPIAPDSNWLISNLDCRIDGGWGDDIAITISRHEDHRDLAIYDPAFKSVKHEAEVAVRFGAGGRVIEGRDFRAVGYRDGKSRFYVANVDDGMLDAVAAAGTFQFYRDALEVDLDMKALAPALTAMRVCEAERGEMAASAGKAADAAFEEMVPVGDEAP